MNILMFLFILGIDVSILNVFATDSVKAAIATEKMVSAS